MAIKHFLGGRIVLGTEFYGYKIGIFEAGTSTAKTTYKDSSLTVGNENTAPVVLDSNGAAQIWFDGNAKAIFYTPADVVVYTDDNINVASTSTATGSANLILNESFEEDTDADGFPDNWTRTLYSTGAFTIDSTVQFDGAKSVKFTSIGSGGGYITSTANYAVSPSTIYTVGFALKSSVANVRNVVEILWYKYDGSASATATTTIYDDSTANPTGWAERWNEATSPSDAAFAKIRLTGCHSSNSTAGSTWFDSVKVTQFAIKKAINTFAQGIGPSYIQNIGMIEAVGTNALTINLTDKDGNTPSLQRIVSWACRPNASGSGGTATYQIVQGTAAKSVTVPATASLGFANSELGYIYRYLSYDGTTSQLAISKRAVFHESILQNVTAISASGTSSETLYGGTAQTNAAIRLIGRGMIAASGTAGNWTVTSTRLEMWHPGMKKTGDIVNRYRTAFGSVSTSAINIPLDNSIPQVSEGAQIFSLNPVGISTANKYRLFTQILAAAAAGNSILAGFFNGTNTDALAAVSYNVAANGVMNLINAGYEFAVPQTGTTTISVRAGATSGQLTVNGANGTQLLGGVGQSYFSIEEIQE